MTEVFNLFKIIEVKYKREIEILISRLFLLLLKGYSTLKYFASG